MGEPLRRQIQKKNKNNDDEKIVFSPRSTFDLVRSGQMSNFREKLYYLALHAHSGVSMCHSDLKPSPEYSPFNYKQDRVL